MWKRFDFKDYDKLTFETPDIKTFKNLALAREAMVRGGNAPCILNAANEIVVQAFLQNKVGFLEMSEIIGQVLETVTPLPTPDIEALFHSDYDARIYAAELVKKSQLSAY